MILSIRRRGNVLIYILIALELVLIFNYWYSRSGFNAMGKVEVPSPFLSEVWKQIRNNGVHTPHLDFFTKGLIAIVKTENPKSHTHESRATLTSDGLRVNKGAGENNFPFFDYEVANLAEALFVKLKDFPDCMRKHAGSIEPNTIEPNTSHPKLRHANQQCLREAFAELEKLLIKRGVAVVGYGGIGTEENLHEESAVHVVRAGRAEGGGWFLFRKGMNEAEQLCDDAQRAEGSYRGPCRKSTF